MNMSATKTVMQLYPEPQQEVTLHGLYLQPRDAASGHDQRFCIYTNFINSLDGRIAIEQPVTGERGVPDSITNSRDWRLYQELAAMADVLLVSARYMRELTRGEAQASLPVGDDEEFADLRQWRLQQGLAPQPAVVILSSSLDLPLDGLRTLSNRRVYVATGKKAAGKSVSAIEESGARMLYAGENSYVDGKQLAGALAAEGFFNIYSIAGPGVLETLLRSSVLDRIYLTQVHRLIGGRSYDTLFEGDLLKPPVNFALQALYYDGDCGKDCSQFFGIYEMVEP